MPHHLSHCSRRMPHFPALRERRAFTLIELLIAIAIIAIFAAILFPVYGRARDAARRTTALSSLRQIGLAVQQYTQDADERLPPRDPISATWPGYALLVIVDDQRVWRTKLEPYVKDDMIWYSPDDRLINKGGSSFAINLQLGYAWPLSEIHEPASTIYLADRTDLMTTGPGMPPFDYYSWWLFTDPPIQKSTDLPGHVDAARVDVQISPQRYMGDLGTYLFLDGHVRALRFDQTWGDAAHNLHNALK